MKILAICITTILAFIATKNYDEKKYKVEYTQSEWQARYNWIEVAKSQLKKSNLPASDVLFITDSLLGKFQGELAAQLQPQFAQDTIKKKTK